MTPLVSTLLTAVALLLAVDSAALPIEEYFSDIIFMPGDLPTTNEVDNGKPSVVSYNNDSSTDPVRSDASVSEPLPLKMVDGRLCDLSFGTIEHNGTCQRLLTQSVCFEGEWLVKKNDTDEGKCVPRPCPDGQLQYENICVNVSDRTVCNVRQMLYVDLTGHVECDCEPKFFYDPWNGQCFTQHDRGSCNFGKYHQVTESGSVECVPNPCELEGFVHIESIGRCYRKMYRGICEDPPSHLKLHHGNQTAECVTSDTKTIFDLPTLRACAAGSRRDFSRRCRQLYRVPAETVYKTASYGTCRLGFVKDATGTCRKTHKLFG